MALEEIARKNMVLEFKKGTLEDASGVAEYPDEFSDL
jgi:hypothetical protein